MMPKRPIRYLCLLLLLAIAKPSFGQYFNTLHDVDSIYEWGMNISQKTDGSYFVNGWGVNQTIGQPEIFNLRISPDGQNILNKKRVRIPGTAYYLGDPGQLRKAEFGYIAPVTVQRPSGTYLSSQGGILKYDENGDTVFTKVYTDTSVYFENMYCCSIMPNGDLMVGGSHATNLPSHFPGILMRTDTSGDSIWTHTYQKVSSQDLRIRTIIPLNDGRIVLGAQSTYTYSIGSTAFYHHTPWFLLLDGAGNIIRDTLYGVNYGLGGALYKDANGGYIHFGWIDTVAVPAFANDLQNFPYYIAHLDTNFRIEWLTRFPFSDCNSRRSPCQIKQLHDGNFLILGDDYCNGCLCAPAYSGWAAKVERTTGSIIWNRNYWTDTGNVAYLRDMVELPDGNMVFVGSAFNDTLPAWHGGRDVWIFGTDSNGCILPGCTLPNSAPPTVRPETSRLTLYPNPTTGTITINAPQPGEMVVCNIQGQVIMQMHLKKGASKMSLPSAASAGMYICRYIADSGDKTPVVVRVVYKP
jgi:uncharacterized protein YodC (DUF2158 family)